jgi:DNA-binding GntR family transcriptional regulator
MSRLSEKFRESIEEEIATGKLPPGTHLDEIELAERFGVSRTPIRETLSLLAGEGLVEIRPRKGAVVAHVTPQKLIEMFEVMAELEAMCARLAARRITEKELQALSSAHQACMSASELKDSDAYFYANEKFHQTIYAAAHNQFLLEQASSLQRRLRPFRRLQLRVRHRLQNSLREHQGILNAISEGNVGEAAERMQGHVAIQGERFTDLLSSLNVVQD